MVSFRSATVSRFRAAMCFFSFIIVYFFAKNVMDYRSPRYTQSNYPSPSNSNLDCSLQSPDFCLVSVITPFCNRIEATLNAVQSIALQTHASVEHILVMDDLTTTKTCAVSLDQMKSLVLDVIGENYNKKHHFVVVSAEVECTKQIFKRNRPCLHGHAAPGFVRNIGMNLARGHFFAFLDDDDLALENRIEVQVHDMLSSKLVLGFAESFAMEKNALFFGRFKSDGSFCRLNSTRAFISQLRLPLHTRDVTMAFMKSARNWNQSLDLPNLVPIEIMRQHNVMITSTVIVNGTFLRSRNLQFDAFATPGNEDYSFWLKIMEASNMPVYFTSTPLGVQDTFEHGRWNGGR